LDVSDEAKWVEYAYETDNRIARHTALIALGSKALESPELSSHDLPLSNLAAEGSKLAEPLTNRLGEIFKLSDNLESPDLAIDALDAISKLAERFQDISSRLKGNETLGLVVQGMRDLERRLKAKGGNAALSRLKQSKDETMQRLLEQLAHLDSAWKTLIAARFCDESDRHPTATVAATR
jgi:hypothetical protein